MQENVFSLTGSNSMPEIVLTILVLNVVYIFLGKPLIKATLNSLFQSLRKCNHSALFCSNLKKITLKEIMTYLVDGIAALSHEVKDSDSFLHPWDKHNLQVISISKKKLTAQKTNYIMQTLLH